VSIINSRKSERIKISEEFCSILEQCLTFNTLTDYCFDVCINSKNPVVPGMKNFLLDTEKRTVQPLNAGINFDFGGFAKGYALDKIRTIFLTTTVSNALVNFGNSSILGWGHHPHGNCWKINLQHSYHPQLSVYTFDLSGEILTTSGILPSHKAHIRSPITHEWCTENATYSVVTKSAVEGEAISTALVAARDVTQQKSILKNFGLKSALKISYEHENFQQEEILV
jgi:thiamine biosynthesis lipoprotein